MIVTLRSNLQEPLTVRTLRVMFKKKNQGASEKTGFVFFAYLKEKLKTVFKLNYVYNRSAFYSLCKFAIGNF